jgi:hypothetical protein
VNQSACVICNFKMVVAVEVFKGHAAVSVPYRHKGHGSHMGAMAAGMGDTGSSGWRS